MIAPRLYLVCGLPGAGKTTRSREIADRLRIVHLCADDWVVGLGVSLVDFAFRVKLQDRLLAHAADLLRCGVSVVIEFGSWSAEERERIRQTAVREGAATELHFLKVPQDELIRRIRARGGPAAEALVDLVLRDSAKFEEPTPEETSRFERYVGPSEVWSA